MTPGISNFVFKTPLSGEISIARLQVNTVNRLGWELTAVFNEARNGEIQAFGIFRRSTDAALQATLANLEEKQKALAAQETAFAEDRKTFDAVVEAGKQMEAKILALEKANAEILVQEQDAKARQISDLETDLKKSDKAFAMERELSLGYAKHLNDLRLAHKALEEKYGAQGDEAQDKLTSAWAKIEKLKKELRGYKKPVMKVAVKAPAKPAEKYRKKK